MAIEITVPSLGESVTEATVAKWLKRPGEPVAIDEPVAELETDKITLEIYAPAAGTLAEILADEGANVPVGAILGKIAEGAAASEAPHPPADAGPSLSPPSRGEGLLSPSPRLRGEGRGEGQQAFERSGPAVRKLIEESGLDTASIAATGPGGRISKADVIVARTPAPSPPVPSPLAPSPSAPTSGEREVRVRMTRLRRRIAERLKAAQNTAAILTTFNEIDMSQAMALRERY